MSRAVESPKSTASEPGAPVDIEPRTAVDIEPRPPVDNGPSTPVEVGLRANLVTDAAVPVCLPVTLRHDPADDPRALTVVLPVPGPGPGRHTWTFPRALLEAGLRSPAEQGDVRVWPCGRVQAVLELHAAQGMVLLQFDCAPLVRFLRRTYG